MNTDDKPDAATPQHTPTPWTFKEQYGAITIPAKKKGHGITIAMVDVYYKPSERAPFPQDSGVAKANGAFIVHCVNAHKQLTASLAACRKALEEALPLMRELVSSSRVMRQGFGGSATEDDHFYFINANEALAEWIKKHDAACLAPREGK